MTTDPKDEATEIRCPLGFTVKPVRPVPQECGHDRCMPATCERLRRSGVEIHCTHWESGE